MLVIIYLLWQIEILSDLARSGVHEKDAGHKFQISLLLKLHITLTDHEDLNEYLHFKASYIGLCCINVQYQGCRAQICYF